jgi:DNA polymerase-3 subunit gamma/tau
MATGPSSHLVLARKWRPEHLTELVGQEAAARTLAQALKSGRIAHAFLFTGIRGVGKTTAARILARCLNCEHGPTPEPCGECSACIEIRAGRSLDVSEIDGATYRKIDDARAIIENLSYRPARDRFKIYIIDEAHQLTDQAFNALLKTLEEPPEHVKFILATTEPQKMPETILSRLQRYDFRRIPIALVLTRLKELARREGAGVEEGALRLIAREAGGSMRDAERMLETALATADGKVGEADVAAALGVASRSAVLELAEAVIQHDAAAALAIVRDLNARGANLESFGRDLLETLRHLVVASVAQGSSNTLLDDLPDHEVAELKRLCGLAGMRDLMRLFRLMASAQEDIIRSSYADMILEMAVVRMAMLEPVMDADELIRAIGNAGAKSGSSAPPSSAPPSVRSGGSDGAAGKPVASGMPGTPVTASTRRIPMAGEVRAEAPRRQPPAAAPMAAPARAPANRTPDLPDLREHIRSTRAALAGFMEQGAALSLEGDVLTVMPLNDIYVRYLADNRPIIAELAAQLYGRRIRVEIAAPGAAAAIARGASEEAAPQERETAPRVDTPPRNGDKRPVAGASLPAGSDREQLYADPIVRGIFETLEARLVEVRETSPPVAADNEASAGDAEQAEE